MYQSIDNTTLDVDDHLINNEEEIGHNQKEFMKDIQRKRLLLRYKQQNNSLRNQLKQLNQRLNSVLDKQSNKVGIKNKLPSITASNDDVQRRQLDNAYKIIDLNKKQIQHLKEIVNQDQHEKIKHLEDVIKERQEQIEKLKKQIKVYSRLNKVHGGLGFEDINDQKHIRSQFDDLNADNIRLKKLVRDLEREKTKWEKDQLKRQQYLVSLQQKNRQLASKRQSEQPLQQKKYQNRASTITHLQLTEENWNLLKTQYLQLKQAKSTTQTKLRAENAQLRGRISILQKSMEILKGRQQKAALTDRRDIPRQPRKNSATQEPQMNTTDHNNNYSIPSSPFPEQNDKNYNPSQKLNLSLELSNIPKRNDELVTLQSYQWGKSVDRKWSDLKVYKENKDIRIVGGTVWTSDVVIGIKFIYKTASNKTIYTEDHVVLKTKQYHKNPFEFNNENDFLQNIILYEMDNRLVGMTLISKQNNSVDIGRQSGKSIDLGIKQNQRPVYAYGSLSSIMDINKTEKTSLLASLGLQVMIS